MEFLPCLWFPMVLGHRGMQVRCNLFCGVSNLQVERVSESAIPSRLNFRRVEAQGALTSVIG